MRRFDKLSDNVIEEKWNHCEALNKTSFRKTVDHLEALVRSLTLMLRPVVWLILKLRFVVSYNPHLEAMHRF